MDDSVVVFTGGRGLLGSEFKRVAPQYLYPGREEFDVTDYASMERYVGGRKLATLIHAAAFTSPPSVDKDPLKALDVNIVGTANVVRLCAKHSARLVYISTDYVFAGDKGLCRETDPVHPVNKYAWSKLGGECAARLYDRALIVRTTFGPNRFPYEKAFADQWTSREPVSVFARKLAAVVRSDLCGVLHVGGKRQTVLEYARGLDPSREIQPLSIKEVSFKVPVDTSLDCDLYRQNIESKKLE